MALSRSRSLAAVVFSAALAFGVGSAVLAPESDALVSVSTITAVHGAVLSSRGGAEFVLAREGDVLAVGDTIRTGTGAAVEITYFEGSSVRVEANTEAVVVGLSTCDDGPAQALGRAWHVVTKLISGGSRYETRTPSATASVRG